MQKRSLIKNLFIPFISLSIVVVLFSSCHRGYGCPGHLGQEEIEAPKQQMEMIVLEETC